MATNAGTPWLIGPNNKTMTLRIERSVRQGFAGSTLSGHMKAEEVAELKALFDADYKTIVLNLRDLRLADRDAVNLERGSKGADVSRENRAASNALAAKCRQLQLCQPG